MKHRKFTAKEWKAIRAEEQRLLDNIESLPAERQLLVRTAERNRRYQAEKKAGVPEVGLFFLVNGKVLMDGQPFTLVTSHAGFRTHPVDHAAYWRQLQRIGVIPASVDYDEVPRGRVTYEDASRKFTLFADKCILKNKKALSKIMNEFRLPPATKVLSDEHYRCPGCSKRNKKQEEADWDV